MNIGKIPRIIKSLLLKIKRRFLTEYSINHLYPYLYKKYSEKEIENNKIIFIESRLRELSNSFQVLHNTLKDDPSYKLNIHFLRKTFVSEKEYITNCKSLIKDMATAKYIFMDEATHIFAKIKLRDESQLVQLWHGCGAFKKFGYSVTDGGFGASQKAKQRYPIHTNYTLATVSSEEVIPHFEEAMGYQNKKGIVKALGVSRTDVFFNDDYISSSRKKLISLFPEAGNKKVILYAPTFRGNVESAYSPDMLDIAKMKDGLSDEYVLITKYHPLVNKRPEIPAELDGIFACDFTDKMAINELLCVSDICISDYSSLVFEYSLFERPMIFFAYDLEEYFDSRGFYYDYDELTPGPVVRTTEDIISYIKSLDNGFDKSVVANFKKKFMSACDGKATQRIIDEVFKSDKII